jgi:hypothetical protein
MDKIFSVDIYQALSYLLPGLALLVPIYLSKSDPINAALQKIGSLSGTALVLFVGLSLGVFLHAVSAFAQHQLEKATGLQIMQVETQRFSHFDKVRERVAAAYDIDLKSADSGTVYTLARTLVMKDGGPLKDRVQLYLAMSVFSRSLILVALIVAGTIVWFRFWAFNTRLLYPLAALALLIPVLVYLKAMYFRLSIDETLRAVLLLTAQK